MIRTKAAAVTIMIVSTTVFASTSAPSINGAWKIFGRACSDGQEPHDNFKLGTDSMSLTILGPHATLKTTVAGQQTEEYLTVDQDNQSIAGNAYVVSQDGRLSVFTGGFGQGGSCPVGKVLKTVFAK